jgi:hypothetical protein
MPSVSKSTLGPIRSLRPLHSESSNAPLNGDF